MKTVKEIKKEIQKIKQNKEDEWKRKLKTNELEYQKEQKEKPKKIKKETENIINLIQNSIIKLTNSDERSIEIKNNDILYGIKRYKNIQELKDYYTTDQGYWSEIITRKYHIFDIVSKFNSTKSNTEIYVFYIDYYHNLDLSRYTKTDSIVPQLKKLGYKNCAGDWDSETLYICFSLN